MTTEIICQQCDNAFSYPEAEQEFRQLRGLARPLLCPACRQRDRTRHNGDLVNLYLRTDSFDPFLLGESTQAGGQRAVRDVRTMHSATCAACGAATKVPFIPRGDRPVYCKDCYNARNGK